MTSKRQPVSKLDLYLNLGMLGFAGVLLFCTEPKPGGYGDPPNPEGPGVCEIVSPGAIETYRRREPVRLTVGGGGTITSAEWSSTLDGGAFVTGTDLIHLDLSVGVHQLTASVTYSDSSTCTTAAVETTIVANNGIAPMTYADIGNGTIANGTGFTWQQQDDASGYNWFEAAGVFDATVNTGTTDVCGDLALGGHDDWRLPTRRELLSAVRYDVAAPTIDQLFIGTSNIDPYWSSDVRGDSDIYAWAVSFQTGGTVSYIERNADYPLVLVRCVRGTMPVGPFLVSNHDGTATDEATGLMWQIADADARTWLEAIDYCDTDGLASHDDWRLPTVMELESIVDITLATGPMAPSPIALQSANYATSTEAFGQPLFVWGVNFTDGAVGYTDKVYDSNRVLCVRLP